MVDQRFSTSVHIMTSLAFGNCENGTLMTSSELAESARTNPTVVRRLVSRLVEAKLVKSYKGKEGGIELARCPQDISLKDIYLAISDGTLLQAPQKVPRKQCPVSCSMARLLGEVVTGVEKNTTDYLAKIKLSDLVGKVTK